MENYSDQIKNFLDFLEMSRKSNTAAGVQEIDMDNRTQDILHNIELCDHNQYGYIVRGIALKDIRQKRREAKNTKEVTKPIVDWIRENTEAIKSLEKLLQATRKIEKRAAGRQYQNRTDTVAGLPGEEDI